MNEIEKIDYIHGVIKETIQAIEIIDLPIGGKQNRLYGKLNFTLDLLEDLREPYLIAIKNKINSGQF